MVKSVMRVCGFSLVLLAVVTSTVVAQVDTDGDGLLDVLDVEGFDGDSYIYLTSLCIEDLDGVNQLISEERIQLVRNKITSIERGDFDGMPNLETLLLEQNQITSIESGSFEGLANLENLVLSDNQIATVESGDFDGLANLKYLELYGNPITSIERGGFEGLPNLETLLLAETQITNVELETLGVLTNLRALVLANSQITSIESGVIDRLANLQSLVLPGNQITSIESGVFGGLAELQDLNLYGNQITSIESGDFDGLANLKTLSLENNQITSIESGAFAGLTNVRALFLRGNEFSNLNFAGVTFDQVAGFGPSFIDREEITALTLDDATLSVGSFDAIISQTTSITDASLVGLTFSDETPADLRKLLGRDSLDYVTVDRELFDLYADEFNAFDAADGNTVTVVPLGDCTKDGLLSASDLACVYTSRSRDAVLTNLNTLPGDFDGDGEVGFADFLVVSVNFGQSGGSYADGNIDLQDGVGFPDFLILSANFGRTNEVAAVPEPAGCWAMVLGVSILCLAKRRRVG